MSNPLQAYKIRFSGLKFGKHFFQFEVKKTFFDEFEYSLVKDGDLTIDIELEKSSTMLVLMFDIKGWLSAPCDICLGRVQQAFSAQEKLVVKFSDEPAEFDSEILSLHHGDNELMLDRVIYEYINLNCPSKFVHEEGECDQEMIDKLNEYSNDPDGKDDTDPRWDALKSLLN